MCVNLYNWIWLAFYINERKTNKWKINKNGLNESFLRKMNALPSYTFDLLNVLYCMLIYPLEIVFVFISI